jgi:hypothetical protein
VHICNYLGGGLNRALLREVREHYPLSFHGVNLNLGGVEKLDTDYLRRLKNAADELQPAMVSEHACFSAGNGQYFHDLMPVPYTAEAVCHMAARIRQVQDLLDRQILIENISRYYRYPDAELSESEFLSALCEESGCGLLLDLNNAWVNQCNLGENLWDFIAGLPRERIGEIHLAGYSVQGDLLIDTHSCEPSDEVWDSFRQFCELNPTVPCLIEWDSNLPPQEELMVLQRRAADIMNQASRTKDDLSCSA